MRAVADQFALALNGLTQHFRQIVRQADCRQLPVAGEIKLQQLAAEWLRQRVGHLESQLPADGRYQQRVAYRLRQLDQQVGDLFAVGGRAGHRRDSDVHRLFGREA